MHAAGSAAAWARNHPESWLALMWLTTTSVSSLSGSKRATDAVSLPACIVVVPSGSDGLRAPDLRTRLHRVQYPLDWSMMAGDEHPFVAHAEVFCSDGATIVSGAGNGADLGACATLVDEDEESLVAGA